MLAAMVNPVLAMKQEEAKALSVAACEVAKHYPAVSTMFDPKIVAWWNLAQTAGLIYGPRVYMMTRKPQPAASVAQPMPGPQPQTMNGGPSWPQTPH